MANDTETLDQGVIPAVSANKSAGSKSNAGFALTMIVLVCALGGYLYYSGQDNTVTVDEDGIEYVEGKKGRNTPESVTEETVGQDVGPRSDFIFDPEQLLEGNENSQQPPQSEDSIAAQAERMRIEQFKMDTLAQLAAREEAVNAKMAELQEQSATLEAMMQQQNDEDMKKRRESVTTVYNALDRKPSSDPLPTDDKLESMRNSINSQIDALNSFATQSQGAGEFDPYGLLGGGEEQQDSVNKRVSRSNSAPIKLEATVIENPDYLLAEGTNIEGVLETAVDSTVPGKVRGRVTQDVYSFNGKRKLISRGTQLNGDYMGDLQNGQAVIFVTWSNAQTCDRIKVPLDSPLADGLGRSGLSGDLETFFWERFGTSLMLSTIGAAAAGDGEDNRLRTAGENFNRSAEVALENSINIRNVLRRGPGAVINVMVNQDIDFSSVADVLGSCE